MRLRQVDRLPQASAAAAGVGKRRAGRGARRAELYGYASDPQESRRIDAQEPEVRKRMAGLARAYLEEEPASWGDAPEIELDDAQLQQLRALGYELE